VWPSTAGQPRSAPNVDESLSAVPKRSLVSPVLRSQATERHSPLIGGEGINGQHRCCSRLALRNRRLVEARSPNAAISVAGVTERTQSGSSCDLWFDRVRKQWPATYIRSVFGGLQSCIVTVGNQEMSQVTVGKALWKRAQECEASRWIQRAS